MGSRFRARVCTRSRVRACHGARYTRVRTPRRLVVNGCLEVDSLESSMGHGLALYHDWFLGYIFPLLLDHSSPLGSVALSVLPSFVHPSLPSPSFPPSFSLVLPRVLIEKFLAFYRESKTNDANVSFNSIVLAFDCHKLGSFRIFRSKYIFVYI